MENSDKRFIFLTRKIDSTLVRKSVVKISAANWIQ